jgi:predicted tellurium resistance membrane protein TerC
VLVSIELSDILFAIDSVPAVLGISADTLIVYLAVMCAVVSLRSVYAVTVVLIERFAYLPVAVSLLLGFVGVKIIADVAFGLTLPTGASLVVIAVILGAGVGVSVLTGAQPRASATYKQVDGGLPLSVSDADQTPRVVGVHAPNMRSRQTMTDASAAAVQ